MTIYNKETYVICFWMYVSNADCPTSQALLRGILGGPRFL